MDKRIILIGGGGVGKSTLRKALMQMLLCQPVVIVDTESINVDVDNCLTAEVIAVLRNNDFGDGHLNVMRNQHKDLRHGFEAPKVTGGKRRNKSERKRSQNRANRWR